MKFVKQHEWVMPENIPDAVFESDIVSIDLETKDPNLTTMGSGWARKDGHIIGVAVAVEGNQWYFPIRHEIGSNFDPMRTLHWLKEVVSVEGVNGPTLKVGSMEEVNTNGNWPKNYSKDQ